MKRLFILTNILSPYRLPIFEGLSKAFDLTVVTGKMETNRPEWADLAKELEDSNVKTFTAAGRAIKLAPDRFVHVNPGYLVLLFRHRPDAVISLEVGFRSISALIYCKLFRKPLWIWWGGTPYSERNISKLKRIIRKFFVMNKVRWLSYGLESTRYLESIGVANKYVLQIQNAVDDKRFLPMGPKAEYLGTRPICLVVGQLIDRKGVQQLLESVARVKEINPNFSIKLIGTGHKQQELKQLVKTLSLTNVEFISGIPPKEMPSYYRGADVLVLPTLEDIWGLVVNEAILCGLPVIASRYAACVGELLSEEDVFDPLVPEDIDRALLRAINGQVGFSARERLWPMSRVVQTIQEGISAQLK